MNATSLPSLFDLSANMVALSQLQDTAFRVSVDKSGKTKVDLSLPACQRGVLCNRACSGLPSKLKPRVRCARRELSLEIMRWGAKHDDLLRLAGELGFECGVRMLKFKGNKVLDYQTAESFLSNVDAPEEFRLCIAALYCLQGYYDIKFTKLSSTLGSTSMAAYLLSVYRLRNNVADAGERKRWFRKLCHKGFTKLALHMLIECGEENLSFEPSDLILMYLHATANGDAEACRFAESKRKYAREVIARSICLILHRYVARPALFEAAFNLIEESCDYELLRDSLVKKITPTLIISACLSYNVCFVRAVLKYGRADSLSQCQQQLIEFCRNRDGLTLAQVVDTICSVSPACWHALLRWNQYMMLQIACERECPVVLETLLENAPENEIMAMLDAAVPHFPNFFLQLCSKGQLTMIRVLQRYLAPERWAPIISWDDYACAVAACTGGFLNILELLRKSCADDGTMWMDMLGQMRQSKMSLKYPLDVVHFLYIEGQLRAQLEEEAADWQLQSRGLMHGI